MLFFPGSDPDPWKRNGAQIQFIFTQWFINALQYPQAFQTFFLIFLLNYLSKHNISEAETRLWSNLQAEKQAWCPFRSRFRPNHHAPRNQGTGTYLTNTGEPFQLIRKDRNGLSGYHFQTSDLFVTPIRSSELNIYVISMARWVVLPPNTHLTRAICLQVENLQVLFKFCHELL